MAGKKKIHKGKSLKNVSNTTVKKVM